MRRRILYGLTAALATVLLLFAAAIPATAVDPTPSPSSANASSTPGATASPPPTPSPTGGVDPSGSPSGPLAFDGALAVRFVSDEDGDLAGARVTLVAVLGRGAALAYRRTTDRHGIARFSGLPRPAHGAPPFDWELDAQLTRITVHGPCTTTLQYRGSASVEAASVPRGITIIADDGGSSISCRTVVETPRVRRAASGRTSARPAAGRGGNESRGDQVRSGGGGADGRGVAVRRVASPGPGLTPPATDSGPVPVGSDDMPLVALVLVLAAATVALVVPDTRRSR